MKSILKITISILVLSVFFSSCQKDIISNPINANLKPPTADAGVPQTIILPTYAGTLNGTGISYNGPITGYLWSLISGPQYSFYT